MTEGLGYTREKKACGCERDQGSERLWKSERKSSRSSVSQLMELPSSSGGLLVVCRDVSPPVERLSHHIVQQALIRQPWPPGVLISIARGRGNPRQGPAGHLITAVAPSSLNLYYCLLSYVLTLLCLLHPPTQTHTHMHTPPPFSHGHSRERCKTNHFCNVDVMALVLVCCGSLKCYLNFYDFAVSSLWNFSDFPTCTTFL